jgi:hypothetical protein
LLFVVVVCCCLSFSSFEFLGFGMFIFCGTFTFL